MGFDEPMVHQRRIVCVFIMACRQSRVVSISLSPIKLKTADVLPGPHIQNSDSSRVSQDSRKNDGDNKSRMSVQ